MFVLSGRLCVTACITFVSQKYVCCFDLSRDTPLIDINFVHRKFENVYVGWGLKYQPGCFQPALPGAGEQEHVKTEFITETDDPTPEEEAALRAAQEGAEEQEQEEEDEEEDDD